MELVYMIKKILLLLMFLPVYLLAWKMESGKETLPATTVGSSTWQTITLQQTYDTTPLIFVLVNEGSGYNGDSPVSLRIRNITTTSFEVVQVEPQSSVGDVEGQHPSVGFHYIAIEPGDHTLGDGTKILASTISTADYQGKNASGTKSWDSVTYPSSFSTTPVVLTTIQSFLNEESTLPGESSSPWMTVTMQGSDSSGFEIALERAETSVGDITNSEEIGYIAIDPDVQGTIYAPDCTPVQYETIQTSNVVNGWQTLCYESLFVNTYTVLPNVIGSHNSRNGADGGWLRRCSLSTTQVGVTIDEDQAGDSERDHGGLEIAGIAVFEQDFMYDSAFNSVSCGLVAEYRMDECYWLNNSATPGDVKDTSVNGYEATSSGSSSIDQVIKQINSAGSFGSSGDRITLEDSTVLNSLTNKLTISAWLYPTSFTGWSSAVQKTSSEDWADGFGLIHNSGDGTNITFYINTALNGEGRASVALDLDSWNHIVGVYNGSSVQIYKNGVLSGSSLFSTDVINSNQALNIGNDVSDASYSDVWEGNLDEVKLWDRALNDQEIANMEGNESIGNNYDGTTRAPITCEATVNSNSWELVGIPIDLRTDPKTVAETFQGMTGTYGTDWRVFRRDYSDTNNSSWYTYLDDPDNNMTEFGKGYWLGNALGTEETWNVDGTQAVEYDSTHPDCPANQCVEIDVKSVSLDFTTDTNDGTGPYRYNLTGFVGKSPVSWADCRFIIDGTAYTPTAAESAGYVSKVIWQYNPGNSGTDANGYTSCDDTTPGTCLLEPYKGFWVELREITKDKTVKLLIPQE